ncbi:hypothetical protein QC763_120440 [Podospora pseudopauciseta]|uniref:NADH:ubiquinone oxidoreductase intermediate-associated protein 30 domain-containing protein n=2 Tax=Podospora TaxID=5144 RepID=A0ABR0I215_9PEZI|nr:hypothetical protein QC763_120440 [Podospora pseudopauciseta]KAK4682921.1 hypothetical protein QC764_120440 [Podospora pseudoanserina]
MQTTRVLRYKGFWGRSMDELKRLSNIAIKMEGVTGPQGPRELFDFRTPSSIEDCKVMSDDEIGGLSTSHLDWIVAPPAGSVPASQLPSPNAPGYAKFYGNISTYLPADRPDIKRTGYAAFRTQDRPRNLFTRGLWDIDPYIYLALRVKSDGRSYFVNVQTESIVPTDLHQHRLFVKKPGEWETVLIKWNNFVRTNHGFVVEPQTEILRQKVKSIGVGLTDRIPGPFELCIERMWATNDESDADQVVDASAAVAAPEQEAPVVETKQEGDLKTKRGEKVAWGSR